MERKREKRREKDTSRSMKDSKKKQRLILQGLSYACLPL